MLAKVQLEKENLGVKTVMVINHIIYSLTLSAYL